MENTKEKIQGILLNCSQKSVIGWAVEESDFEHVAEEIVKNLALSGVSTTLPNINSSTFKNYLEAKGYAETLNPLVYKKQGFEYDKEILHRHFLNEIEFGN